MARKQRTYAPRTSPSVPHGKQPPQTTAGDKRAFDARPKPSQTSRRDETPIFHIDPEPRDPFDHERELAEDEE